METIKAGDKEVRLYSFSGKVFNTNKNMETKVHGSGGGGNGYNTAPVRISSTTTVHDHLILEGSDGNQKGFQLQGFNLNCAPANRLTIIWGIKEGKSEGPYLAVHNHTTSETFYQEEELKKMFRYSRIEMMKRAAIVMAAIGVLFGFMAGGFGKAIGYAFYWAIFGAIIGAIFQMTDKKAVQKFKAELNFSEGKKLVTVAA